MKLLNYLKDLARNLLLAICFWCGISLFASFIQALEVQAGRASCEMQTYIEYILFTDLFCEVKK